MDLVTTGLLVSGAMLLLRGSPAATPGTSSWMAATSVPVANGNRVLPDGTVVNAGGQVVGHVSPAAATRLYAGYGAQHGGSSMEILKFAAQTLTKAPEIYKFAQKIIAANDQPAAAGVTQQMLRDPDALEHAVDAAGGDAMTVDQALRLGDSFLDNEQMDLAALLGDDPELGALLFGDEFDVIVDLDTLLPEELGGDLPDLPIDTVPIDDVVGVVDDIPFGFDDLAAYDVAGDALDAGIEAGAGVVDGLGGVVPVAGAVVKIGFDLASDMPSDQKAASVALDVANLALAFIPVIGWALAIVASMFKSAIVGMFGGLSHEQREQIEVARTLQGALVMWKLRIRPSVTPTQLYDGIAEFASGSLGGHLAPAISVSYRRPNGARIYVGQPYNVEKPYPAGNPQDFIASVVANPAGVEVGIQAGVRQDKLAAANHFFATQIVKRCTLIHDAHAGDAEALKVLAHVWHIARDPVVNVRAWLDGTKPPPQPFAVWAQREVTVMSEMPLLAELLLSLYYNDLAAMWGVTVANAKGGQVGSWKRLVGQVMQPQWTTYRTSAQHRHQAVTLPGFLTSLGYRDVRQLRADVFAGRYPAASSAYPAMTARLGKIEHNELALRRMLAVAAPQFGPGPFVGRFEAPADWQIADAIERFRRGGVAGGGGDAGPAGAGVGSPGGGDY